MCTRPWLDPPRITAPSNGAQIVKQRGAALCPASQDYIAGGLLVTERQARQHSVFATRAVHAADIFVADGNPPCRVALWIAAQVSHRCHRVFFGGKRHQVRLPSN